MTELKSEPGRARARARDPSRGADRARAPGCVGRARREAAGAGDGRHRRRAQTARPGGDRRLLRGVRGARERGQVRPGHGGDGGRPATNWRVTVDVTDDGIGGADPAHGSGLVGLADRVAALDGTFPLTSRRAVGRACMSSSPRPARRPRVNGAARAGRRSADGHHWRVATRASVMRFAYGRVARARTWDARRRGAALDHCPRLGLLGDRERRLPSSPARASSVNAASRSPSSPSRGQWSRAAPRRRASQVLARATRPDAKRVTDARVATRQ